MHASNRMISKAAAILFASGSATATQNAPAAPASPLPLDYQVWVEKVVLASLKDPDSAKLEFRTPPYRMVCRKGVFHNLAPVEIWMIDVWVNAKNSFGGYVGFQGWSVGLIPERDGSTSWQAYTKLGGGALTEYRLCKSPGR